MNKPILTSSTILCLLSILFLMGCKISAKAGGATIIVPDDYLTIQEAINHANSGDTIFVYKGTYYEQVVVNKSVSLIGENRDSTIIDGNETGRVISIMANNVSIEGFLIRKSGKLSCDCGIFVDDSIGNDISHNTIANNYDGISLNYSSNNVVTHNTVIDNNYDGISLRYSSNNVVTHNTVTDNYDGISLRYSSNNVITHNTVTNNYDGISLRYSSNNVITHNTVTNNYYGSLIRYSSDNTICTNNFNNTYQEVWSDSTNVWDNGKEGNHWSDYAGQDLNGDGVGDSPYVIDVNNQDNYPLMGIFSYFNATSERETYYITTICNSTISEFKFETGPETGNKIIRFNAAGEDGTVGFCRVMIPTELMNYPYIVLVDVEEVVPTLLAVSNDIYAYLYFTYTHSSHTITIISSKALYLYNKLQIDLYNLNTTYYDLLNNYSILLENYSKLQESHRELNHSYQEHLSDYSQNVRNIQNLIYIFAATTAIFIITTIYLSKRAHARKTRYSNTTNRC